jgi:hypothetical protein
MMRLTAPVVLHSGTSTRVDSAQAHATLRSRMSGVTS